MGHEIPYLVSSYKEDPTDFDEPNPNDEIKKQRRKSRINRRIFRRIERKNSKVSISIIIYNRTKCLKRKDRLI